MTKHSHVIFHFTDGSSLVYQDVRKFGTMELLRKEQITSYFTERKLGPEPTESDFHLLPFETALKKSKKLIKPYLLDQTLVAGLGNIYVDEVLWRAQIHPARAAKSLTAGEAEELRKQIIAVLQLGIEKGGSTIRTYAMLWEKTEPCRISCKSMEKQANLVLDAVTKLKKSN